MDFNDFWIAADKSVVKDVTSANIAFNAGFTAGMQEAAKVASRSHDFDSGFDVAKRIHEHCYSMANPANRSYDILPWPYPQKP